MNIEVGSIWRYNAAWAQSRYEVVEIHEDGVIMRITYNGRSDNVFCSFRFIENGLVQVKGDL
jgi:hypothetical protein